ncbi:hypothetical protein QVD17_09282 [Tagetes erecta]|uniref:Uncharacterized protein n=1 Tax=Tagetes erecta TaxID=13708 RepID=A0AAD8L421_TARER|nr:hypothetical protein QVD17_09282 [Tagetes erecta]
MCSSINSFFLNSPSTFHQSQTHLRNHLSFNPILKLSPKPTSIITYLTKPTSHHPQLTSSISPSPHKPIPKFISEKIVFLLLGSFAFMGFSHKNIALAKHAQPTTQTESSEAQNVEIERNVEALMSVFDAKMKRGKTKEAIEYVERLIVIEPKVVEWKLLQVLCYEMVGDHSKAESLFENILKEGPLLLRALHEITQGFESSIRAVRAAKERLLQLTNMYPSASMQQVVVQTTAIQAEPAAARTARAIREGIVKSCAYMQIMFRRI